MANILLAHAGRSGSGGITEAAAEIARAAARAWIAPLLDTACERLAFVLRNLFDIAIESIRRVNSSECKWNFFIDIYIYARVCVYTCTPFRLFICVLCKIFYLLADGKKEADMEGHIGFHAAVRRSYDSFIKDLSKQCKQLVRHHLDSVTSTYSRFYYDSTPSQLGLMCSESTPASSFVFDLSEGLIPDDQENVNPNVQQETTPVKGNEVKGGVLRESQLTVPETPSPDQFNDPACEIKKEPSNLVEIGGRKRQARMIGKSSNSQGGVWVGAELGPRKGSAYSEICQLAVQHFSRIRQILIERNVPSTLNSGLLTPWCVLLFSLSFFSLS